MKLNSYKFHVSNICLCIGYVDGSISFTVKIYLVRSSVTMFRTILKDQLRYKI